MSATERKVVHEYLQGPRRRRDVLRGHRARPAPRRRPARADAFHVKRLAGRAVRRSPGSFRVKRLAELPWRVRVRDGAQPQITLRSTRVTRSTALAEARPTQRHDGPHSPRRLGRYSQRDRSQRRVRGAGGLGPRGRRTLDPRRREADVHVKRSAAVHVKRSASSTALGAARRATARRPLRRRAAGDPARAARAPAAPTSVHDPAAALDVHVADSLVGLEVAALRCAGLIADLGAGARPPGARAGRGPPATRASCSSRRARASARSSRRGRGDGRSTNVEVACARAEEWTDGVGRVRRRHRPRPRGPRRCSTSTPRRCCATAAPLVAWKGAVASRRGSRRRCRRDAARPRGGAASAVRPFAGSERRTPLRRYARSRPRRPAIPRRPGMATKRPLSVKNLR